MNDSCQHLPANTQGRLLKPKLCNNKLSGEAVLQKGKNMNSEQTCTSFSNLLLFSAAKSKLNL